MFNQIQTTMKEILKERFFGIIKNKGLDVLVEVRGEYPFLTIFKFRNGVEFGRCVPSKIDKENLPYPWYTESWYVDEKYV